MGTKRKLGAKQVQVPHDKTSNGCSETKRIHEKLHTDNSNAMAPKNIENNANQNSNSVPLENSSEVLNMVLRRSERLKGSVPPSKNLGAKPIMEHVNLVETEKEEEAPHNSQQVDTLPIVKEKELETLPIVKEKELESLPIVKEKELETLPIAKEKELGTEMNERSFKEKIDYLVRVVDEFKSKTLKQVNRTPDEGLSTELKYKSLYFNSQKKIEALIEENYELVRKLEFAHGKIAAYEAKKDSAAKEVYLVTALGKATETAASLSPELVQKWTPPPPPPPAPATIPDDADNPKTKIKYQKRKKGRRA